MTYASLEPDRAQLKAFIEPMFRHAGCDGFVSMRSFFEEEPAAFRISPASLKGGLRFLLEVAEDDARRAANYPKKVVFCPPIAVFSNKDHAREVDIALGLVLSAECDTDPDRAATKLEDILGTATIAVSSGGTWVNPQTGELHDRQHLHWRLCTPAKDGTLAKLTQARDLAARLIGGDPSGKSIVHPYRWPGSWHRKKEPRLCVIKAANPDREIDLEEALAALRAHSPTTGNKTATPPSEWRELIKGVAQGSRNTSIARLTGHLLHHRVDPIIALELLQGWNARSCSPPLTEGEVARIVDSIAGKELASRRRE
jgi:Primase C terminal 1 (PriCT-1)